MNSIPALSPNSISLVSAPKPAANLRAAEEKPQASAVAKAEDIREAFTSFVGETFYAQMMKAMRSTVDKPAYFHGGRAEEVFRSQLDQQMAQEWAESSGDRFAEPMFEQQFPEQARILREASAPLAELAGLRRK